MLMLSVCFVVAILAIPSLGLFTLEPTAFMKLPDAINLVEFERGTANKASYDANENFLYVIGQRADVLHVISMGNPRNPSLVATKSFHRVNQGLPTNVKVCRGGLNRNFLAISFESPGENEKAHVHFYELFDAISVHGPLVFQKDIIALNSFDPSSIAWDAICSHLLVVSRGHPHEINGVFDDPRGDMELLMPSFATTVDRRTIPIVESALANARIRQVFHTCDTGATTVSTRVQDLEPTAVHVDANYVAYVLFQGNNAIGKYDLNRPQVGMQYYDLGKKNWTHLPFDGAYEDNGIHLRERHLYSFYQPHDLVSFQLDGKIFLATADMGTIRRYSMNTCHFDESVEATNWRQAFSDGMSSDEIAKLTVEMRNNAEIGRLHVSKLRTPYDGWDPLYQGYDFVSTYGGRGFSILNPEDMSRVYDSGNDFESYFLTASERDRAMFNADFAAPAMPQSSNFDRRSPELGPSPSNIAVGDWNGTKVLFIANGAVGGIYVYSVTSGPTVTMESYLRRGQPGISWREAFERNDDSVGEPEITDLLFIDDEGAQTVVAVSSAAGALSFYNLHVS